MAKKTPRLATKKKKTTKKVHEYRAVGMSKACSDEVNRIAKLFDVSRVAVAEAGIRQLTNLSNVELARALGCTFPGESLHDEELRLCDGNVAGDYIQNRM